MSNSPRVAHTEHPLSEATRRTFMLQHPVYSYRRYLYQTFLLTLGLSALEGSLHNFERVTLRSPAQFLPRATTLIQQMQQRPGLARSQHWLWTQLAPHAHVAIREEDDTASVPAIYYALLRSCRMMTLQGKPFLLPDHNQQRRQVHTDWQSMIRTVTILLHEQERVPTMSTAHTTQPAPFDPYPDATMWRNVLENEPAVAEQWYRQLCTYQAETVVGLHFNAYESMRLYIQFQQS